MGASRKTNAQHKRDITSYALRERLEEMEKNKSTGRLILEITVNQGGIVQALMSMQEPVFGNSTKGKN